MQTNRLLVLFLCILMNTSTYAQFFPRGPRQPNSPPIRTRDIFSSTWTLTSPIDGAVYQRGPNHAAVIKIKGSSVGGVVFGSSTLSAQLNQLDMSGNDMGLPAQAIPINVLTSQSGDKSFSGEKSVSDGWYKLTLRATSTGGAIAITDKIMKIGVGEVFIIAGQSNAQGRPNDPFNNNVVNLPLLDAVRVQPDRFVDAEFLTATDPVSVAIATKFKVKKPPFSPLISGREAYNHPNSGIAPLGNSLWYWVAFGEKIAREYQVPVAFFNAAWGGTTIKQWQESSADPKATPLGTPTSNGTGTYDPGAQYGILKNVLHFYGSTYGVRSVLWLQGENDAKALRDDNWQRQRVSGTNPTTQAQDYAAKLKTVINQSRQDLKPRFGDDPLAWVVGKTSTFEGVSVYFPKANQTQTETQSAQTVRAGQEQVITSSGLNQIYRGPDIDAIPDRASGAGEPTHLAGQGLQKAAEAWFFAVHIPDFFNPDPIRPARLGTEPQDLMLDNNGNITTPLPAGAQYMWYNGNGGRIDLNSPAGYGSTMPDGIIDPLVCIEYGDGTCALGSLVPPNSGSTPDPTPNPTPPSGTGSLAFQIVSYDCNSGVLQYKFTSSDNSPVNVTLPGIFGGTMNPNTVATHTFPADARQGRNMTGYATQSGNQANINFTTSCSLSTNNPTPTPTPNPGSGSCTVSNPSSTLDGADCNGVQGWAFDNSNLGQPVTYDIYIDGVKTYAGLTANGNRPDLADYFHGEAFRYHGFSYQFPADASWKNGQNHTISVRICGVNNDMNGSPKTVNGCTGGSQNPNPTPNPTPPSGTGSLAFQIVSYDCNSGVLQYQFTSSDNSPVNVTLPGIFGGTMNPNTVANYTFPGDAKVGRNMTGYATQSGNQANINFTTSCSLSTSNPTPTPTPTPTPPSGGSLAFQIVSYDCNSGALQYKFTSSDGSPVNVTLPGIFGGTMNPNTVANYTFPGDAKVGRTVTGYATQSGNQVNINFTNGCNMPTGARKGVVESEEPTLGTELTLSIQPNPNNGQFEVQLQVPESKPYIVGVTDLLGRVLWKSEGVGTGSKFVKSIDLQGRFVGSAVVYLQSEGKLVSQIVLIKP